MGLTKEHKIIILLCIDAAFFMLELVVGYAVHSLALVADAFHMLNDVLSLCVGLWAVRAAKEGRSNAYTYGLQRAETLGALFNGVFLVALCLSIFLEAIQRFVEPQVVTNPKLVLIVGCLGLASNILGLFLFHDHSHGHDHGHGEAEHSHAHDDVRSVEEGHGHSHAHKHAHKHTHKHEVGEHTPLLSNGKAKDFTKSDEETTTLSARSSETHRRMSSLAGNHSTGHRRRASAYSSLDNIPVHPASMRQEFVRVANIDDIVDTEAEHAVVSEGQNDDGKDAHSHMHGQPRADRGNVAKQSHAQHHHAKPKEKKATGGGGHGHSHEDLNMRGVFLHVLGDALGNVGVIITALIIWLTNWSFRYYFDPLVSLIITVIILCSAIPLCKAASRILLQAVPVDLDIQEIEEDIETLDGVVSAHDLHVWQLSGTKLVASIHVKVTCKIFDGAGSANYMRLAREIQECLHEYGIHSSTIQPEFVDIEREVVSEEASSSGSTSGQPGTKAGPKVGSKAPSLASIKDACMLDCEDSCDSKGQCCPPNTNAPTNNGNNGKSRK